jgi:hypothetical protein
VVDIKHNNRKTTWIGGGSRRRTSSTTQAQMEVVTQAARTASDQRMSRAKRDPRCMHLVPSATSLEPRASCGAVVTRTSGSAAARALGQPPPSRTPGWALTLMNSDGVWKTEFYHFRSSFIDIWTWSSSTELHCLIWASSSYWKLRARYIQSIYIYSQFHPKTNEKGPHVLLILHFQKIDFFKKNCSLNLALWFSFWFYGAKDKTNKHTHKFYTRS